MEFLSGPEGPIVPDPDKKVDEDHLASTEAAMTLLRGNIERVEHFKARAEALGLSGRDAVITLANVDDQAGGLLADLLMPGHDWQQYRDAGQMPVARGLAPKETVTEFLSATGYNVAAAELISTEELRVVVLEAGVALVLDVAFGD